MTEKKITKIDKYNMLLDIAEVSENEMLIEFINHEIELLQKKNSYKSTNKKKIAENTTLANEITEIFFEEPNLMASCSDLVRKMNFKYSTQKIAPQLSKMVESKILKATIEKKIKYYSLV